MADALNTIDWKTVGLALVGGVLPALVWLWFWLKEDAKHPEPKKLILRTFLIGGLSIIPAFLLQKFSIQYLGQFRALSYEPSWSTTTLLFVLAELPIFLVWALIEESLKWFGAYLTAFRTKAYDEPLDAMIYMITAAVGFSAFENVLFLFKAIYQPNWPFIFLLTGNLRFLGATVLHIASSAVLGGIIANTFCSTKTKKVMGFVFGLLTATVLHALFNFFIILNEGRDIFRVLFSLWIASILLIIFFERVKTVVCKINLNQL